MMTITIIKHQSDRQIGANVCRGYGARGGKGTAMVKITREKEDAMISDYAGSNWPRSGYIHVYHSRSRCRFRFLRKVRLSGVAIDRPERRSALCLGDAVIHQSSGSIFARVSGSKLTAVKVRRNGGVGPGSAVHRPERFVTIWQYIFVLQTVKEQLSGHFKI